MCEPATIAAISIGLSAVSTGAGLYAQNQQMHAQADANQTQYENQMTAYRANLANIEVTRNQMGEDATQKVNDNNAQARKATATATAAAGEAGVSGTSVDALLRDLAGQAGFDNTNVETNYLRQNTALNGQRENAFNQTASNINQLKTPTAPDYLGAGLRLGSSALGTYGNYQQQQAVLAGRKG